MIRYRLVCNKKHQFESWFGSSSAFDRLAKKGQVECPECGSKKVAKALMTPGLSKGGRGGKDREQQPQAPVAGPPAPAQASEPPELVEAKKQLVALMRSIRQEVASKAEYVGPKFAEEARKIHHQEAEARGIWGEATLAEARELHEDGIECLPLPRLPEDSN